MTEIGYVPYRHWYVAVSSCGGGQANYLKVTICITHAPDGLMGAVAV